MATVMAVEDDDVQDAILFCTEQLEMGESIAPERTYEEGVFATLKWVIGDFKENPLDAVSDPDEDDDANGQD